jgi:hypothetical protein
MARGPGQECYHTWVSTAWGWEPGLGNADAFANRTRYSAAGNSRATKAARRDASAKVKVFPMSKSGQRSQRQAGGSITSDSSCFPGCRLDRRESDNFCLLDELPFTVVFLAGDVREPNRARVWHSL